MLPLGHLLTAPVQSFAVFICDGLVVPQLEHLDTVMISDYLIQGRSAVLTAKVDIGVPRSPILS